MKIRNWFLILAILCAGVAGCSNKEYADAQVNAIVPHPASIEKMDSGAFLLDRSAAIVYEGEGAENSAAFLKEYLQQHYGLSLRKWGSRKIALKVAEDTSAVEGAYSLEVLPSGINIEGKNPAGLFYGVQTLIQLLPVDPVDQVGAQDVAGESAGKGTVELQKTVGKKLLVPAVKVEDAPAFEYRGMHLDVARHFMPVWFVKKYIDYLALHKLNYFHWHLTDDQGWRIESKKHPRLNEVGSYRDGTIIGLYPGTGVDSTRYGGYYTVEEMKDIVDYAAKRYITIVPEIDLPGHCMAALATYPHLGTESNGDVKPAITWGIYNKLNNVMAPSEEAFAFLEDVFEELMDIFPGEYIHIGMDECCHRWWKESPRTQKFIKEHNLGDEKGLQKYFAQRVSAMVRARGRIAVGWDEMVDNGLEEGVALTVWRGGNRWVPAAEAGHKMIMTPNAKSYLNYKQRPDEKRLAHMFRLVALDTVYKFDPTPDTLSQDVLKNVIGGQGCLWTEYYPTPQAVEYAIFPRISAIAEVYWTQEQLKDYSRFLSGMPVQFARYAMWGVEEPCRYIFQQQEEVATGKETKVAKTAEDGD